MSALFWLSDEAWSAIEPCLPKNQPGARRVDDRRVISGIVHVLKAGCRWKDGAVVRNTRRAYPGVQTRIARAGNHALLGELSS